MAFLGVAVIASGLCLVIPQYTQLRRAPFFDEMWRLYLIHSHDVLSSAKLVPNTTAVPYGWIYVNKALVALLGSGLRVVRGTNIVFFAAGLVTLFAALLFIGRDTPPRRRWVWPVAALAACVAFALTPMVTDLTWYANNYSLDVLMAALLLATSVALGRRRWAFAAALIVIAVMPVFSLSALVLVPAAVMRAALWARARSRQALVLVFVATATSAILAVAVYFVLYRPVVTRPESVRFLRHWWRADRLQSGAGDPLLVGRSAAVLRDDLVGSIWPHLGRVGGFLLTLVVLAAFVAGAVVLCRRWPWFAAFLVSGWLGVLVIGLVTGGPVTPVRVVIGYWVLVALTALFGVFFVLASGLAAVCARAHLPAPTPQVSFALLVLLALLVAWPDLTHATHSMFSLTDEFEVVAASPAAHNTVVAYHYLAEPYARDRLTNDASAGKFTIVPERLEDHGRLYNPLDKLWTAMPRGSMLWCVIPYAIGPRATSRACRFQRAQPRQVSSFHGPQGDVVAYQH